MAGFPITDQPPRRGKRRDHLPLFLILGELSKQRLALFESKFIVAVRNRAFSGIPQTPEGHLASDLRGDGPCTCRFVGLGAQSSLFNHCSGNGKRVHPETEAVMSRIPAISASGAFMSEVGEESLNEAIRSLIPSRIS